MPRSLVILAVASFAVFAGPIAADTAAPLPSWNDGPTKRVIMQFVKDVTTKGSAKFVPRERRIATFDNDGTLWSERPVYFQLQFAIDRIKQLAPQHPEWKSRQPFKAALENDQKALMASGEKGLLQLWRRTPA